MDPLPCDMLVRAVGSVKAADNSARSIATFIQFYNTERRHQSLGYLTPQQYNHTRKDAECSQKLIIRLVQLSRGHY
ncbi:MAG: integrase core domain-containing protein, partial [Kiritimatiellae bacterium]|nr:integrase core domain-containing protein [Kiritimatiellia bacterium]